ncbi:MAG: hypothetical protein OXC80_15270 [Gammaproteobacteria bacterium]|nr:hypothetical protein [Gammaproteobacteria bacterium]
MIQFKSGGCNPELRWTGIYEVLKASMSAFSPASRSFRFAGLQSPVHVFWVRRNSDEMDSVLGVEGSPA